MSSMDASRRNTGAGMPDAEIASAIKQLDQVILRLCKTTDDEIFMTETPLEVQSVLGRTIEDIQAVRRTLQLLGSSSRQAKRNNPDDPTRQQGQFLAFIREFMARNVAGVAPTHANLQRHFDLTAPSVNSMLVRLEQRGFVRRIPGMARAIELTIDPDRIPALEKPFKYL